MSCSLWTASKAFPSQGEREDPPGRRVMELSDSGGGRRGPEARAGAALVGTSPACLPEVLETHRVLCLGFS